MGKQTYGNSNLSCSFLDHVQSGQSRCGWSSSLQEEQIPSFKGLLHCFSTCIEITENNWYCFNLKNVENWKENFKGLKSYMYKEFKL